MATFRSSPLRPRVLQPTKKPPKTPSTTRKPTKNTPKKPTTAKERADAAIAAIRAAKADNDASYYALGKALLKLRKPAIWKLYAAATFREFLDDNVMPHSTAQRMITIAEKYPKTLALKIGLERSFQLARLARIDPEITEPPAQLWRQNAELGGKPVRTMSAAELERLVSAAVVKKRLAEGRKTTPRASQSDKSAIAQFESDWADVFGDLGAVIRFNPRNRTVRIEFHVDELFEED